MLKTNNEIRLKSKYRLKQITISREEMLQQRESAFFEKWVWNFETLNSTFYAKKHTFWLKNLNPLELGGQWGHSEIKKVAE